MHTISAGSLKSFWNRRALITILTALFLVVMPLSAAFAAETEYYPPSNAASSGGATAWLNPSYIFASDNLYAQSAQQNKQLRLSSFNIKAIPGDAVIDGISVSVEGYTAGGRQVNIQFSGDNGLTWSLPHTTDLAATDGVRIIGGSSDKWGKTWTPAQFANATFIAKVITTGGKTGTVYLDQLMVKVHYTPSPIPITVTADPQTKHYGYPDPVLTYKVTSGSLLPGDSFTGNLLRDPGDDPGVYAIHQGTLTAGPGYDITYSGNNLTIDQAPLTVTAQSYRKLAAEPAIATFAFTYNGFVLGQDETALTTLPTCALPPGTDQSVEGVYPIKCDGGASANYTFIYVDGTLTVKTFNNLPTDLTLTPSSVEENHPAGFAVGALANNDPDPDLFVYSLCGGADDTAFTIDGSTLKTTAPFDFETKASYSICLQVDDGFGGVFTKNPTVITVTDLPETFVSRPLYDGWILESTETSGKGGTKNTTGIFFVGDDAANKQYRSILAFNTAGLPDNAVITSAVLKIKQAGMVGTNPFTTHGNILVDILNGGFSGNAGLQIQDFEALASRNGAVIIKNTPVNSWYTRGLGVSNFTYINKAGPTQLRLRFNLDDNNDFGADYLKFYSGNSLLANKPVLVIQYYIP